MNNKNYIAEFEKVSFEQFLKDVNDSNFKNVYNETELNDIYNQIELPKRATSGSAGYDFKSPFDFHISTGEVIKIPSGIRCKMNEGWFLALVPRSGHGFKFRIQLNNTIGIIDQDYYESKNEGHIIVKLKNDNTVASTLEVKQNMGYVQGIFLNYGLACEDAIEERRNGGFGSTTK